MVSLCQVTEEHVLTTEDHVRSTFHSGTVFFVQVGSNDGRRFDPIFRSAVDNPLWSGILIEPVDYAFEQLRENYRFQERFIFEKMAISDIEGFAKFYSVSEDASRVLPDIPEWFNQLGSFDRNHIVKHLEGRLEPFIEEIVVACMPLTAILEKHDVNHIDLLHIDAEGSDLMVLSQFDPAQYRPRMIIFEHWHMNPRDLENAKHRLGEAGYKMVECDLDIIATFGD